MAKEVRIQLTPAQKAKIKSGTGKSMGEIRVSPVGKNLSAKFTAKPMIAAKSAKAITAARVSSRPAAKPLVAAKSAKAITAARSTRVNARS